MDFIDVGANSFLLEKTSLKKGLSVKNYRTRTRS